MARCSNGEAVVTRGFAPFWRQLYEAWESYEHDCHELIDAGDDVVSIVTDRGRGRASGAEVEISAYGVWTIRDGKIVRVVWYPTCDEALEAAGLSE
jgi:ketosteroid isomerase-like protein